jgi:hypothetical protein
MESKSYLVQKICGELVLFDLNLPEHFPVANFLAVLMA